MPSNNSLIPSLWAAKRGKPSIAAASLGAALLSAPFYAALSPVVLSRILRTALANQSGSTASFNLSTLTGVWNRYLFALDASRFILFSQENGSNERVATIFEVGASSLTVGSTTVIRANTSVFTDVKQSPTNPLQFAAASADGYTQLITADASGTTFTTSLHNTSSQGFVFSTNSTGKIVWSPSGDCFTVVGTDGAQGVVGLLTATGTTLAYVNKITTTGWALSNQSIGLAALTGGADNQAVYTMTKTNSNGVNFVRYTFTSSSVTLQASGITGTATGIPAEAIGTAWGTIHTYSHGTAPYPIERLSVDCSGSGSLHISTVSNGRGLRPPNIICPMGDRSFWQLAISTTAANGTTVNLSGMGVEAVGVANLITRSTQNGVGFCVSHDYSKALVLLQNSSTPQNYQALGYNVPT